MFFINSMKKEQVDKVRKYKILNQYVKKWQILFAGSSLMKQFPINELQQTLENQYIIYNRGIGGYVTTELLESMEECIFELEPSKIFINIGTNDIGSAEYKKENLISNYHEILTQIGERLPDCKVYVMAYYPINAKANLPGIDKDVKEMLFKTRTNVNILEANAAVEKLAKKHGYEFINVNEGLMDEEGNLKAEYAIDGVHMFANGYSIILNNLKKYL
ncbi:GDSL-type esterase/lipase family protein [Clostridium beijerinckii]|nr:GDSL-type esterase/lipase family protein [Clostridium beijerinckii]